MHVAYAIWEETASRHRAEGLLIAFSSVGKILRGAWRREAPGLPWAAQMLCLHLQNRHWRMAELTRRAAKPSLPAAEAAPAAPAEPECLDESAPDKSRAVTVQLSRRRVLGSPLLGARPWLWFDPGHSFYANLSRRYMP